MSDNTEQKRIDAKKAELKKQHSDWDSDKLTKTAKMQVGREMKLEKQRAVKEALESQIRSKIKAENPNIDEKELEKRVKETIAQRELDAKIETADQAVKTAHDAFVEAIVARSKLDSKQVELPKDVRDAIEKLKNTDL